MKNKEKFAKEIFDIACRGDSIAITIANNEIVPCESIECEKCIFKVREYEECSDKIKKWCESEYIERPTLTPREKNFLYALLSNFKYIARDFNNSLCIYYNKPKRNSIGDYWMVDDDNYYYVPRNMYGSIFDFIKWEDEEPWQIDDLKKLEVKDE